MTAHITGAPAIPDPEERATRNAALFTDDIDAWVPEANRPSPCQPGEPPS